MVRPLKVQLVGLPQSSHTRLRASIDSWAEASNIDLRHLPSHNPRVPETREGEITQSVRDGYVHILVVPCRTAGNVARTFEFDCRVILLQSKTDLIVISWNELQSLLSNAIEFERKWINIARPTDINAPLLLPPPSFAVHNVLTNFWKHCDCYRSTELLTHANNLLQQMRSLHRRSDGTGSFWLDRSDRVFRPTRRARHGRSPEERLGAFRFRFCFEVPVGFHYDVTHQHGREFSLQGAQEHYSSLDRANVDPWGYVRAAA